MNSKSNNKKFIVADPTRSLKREYLKVWEKRL